MSTKQILIAGFGGQGVLFAGKLLAYDFDGNRYDMGNKLGIMKANCEIAMNHSEIGDDFKNYLKELVKTF